MSQEGVVLCQPPTVVVPAAPIKLDIGCGSAKREGFLGADCLAFPGVDVTTDLRRRWPWPDASVAEAHSSHFVEHLDGMERVHFANELHRVLVPGGKATVIVPHWASGRAYGDPSHKFPPVSEFWFFYLSREWRLGNPDKGLVANAPHTDAAFVPGMFACDFEATWGYSVHQDIQAHNQEVQRFALAFYKEAAQDLIATLICRK